METNQSHTSVSSGNNDLGEFAVKPFHHFEKSNLLFRVLQISGSNLTNLRFTSHIQFQVCDS